MASISLLDYFLMKGLVESVQGQEDEEEKDESNPENYFVVVDPKAWKEAQESCRKEKLVIAMEITNPFSDSCRSVRHLFIRMAKEFDSIPFLRVVTGPGRQLTMEQVCIYTHVYSNRVMFSSVLERMGCKAGLQIYMNNAMPWLRINFYITPVLT